MPAAGSRDPTPSAREPRWPLLVVLAAGLAAWWGVWNCAFVFDDRPAILDNAALQAFDWWGAAFGPEHQPLANRPLACASLALDLWCFGKGPFGPHLGNLVLHLVNGLLVLLTVRAALRAPNLAGRYDAARRTLVATAVAVLWVVHPLGGEAVAYATQRSTLLYGGCVLLALYASLRAAEAAHPARWRAFAVAAVAAGMASKEDMVLAPVLLLLWERAFVVPSWAALRARTGYFAALAATWLVLAACIALGADNLTVGYGDHTRVTAWQWLLTQAGVLVRYLLLVVWPHPLRGAYDDDVVTEVSQALLPGALVLTLLVATIWSWRRRPWWGVLGALFFLLLAPTSSVMPIVTEITAERRMYLPMLAVLVPLVIGCERTLRGGALLPFVGAAIALGLITQQRLVVYGSEASFWTDAYHKRDPASRSFLAGRLLGDYSTVLWRQERYDEAVPVLETMMQCDDPGPNEIHKYVQLLHRQGRLDEAVQLLRREAAVSHPDQAVLLGDLGAVLLQQAQAANATGDAPLLVEAETVLRSAVAGRPRDASYWNSLGGALRLRGRLEDAEAAYHRATELTTERTMPYFFRAELLAQLGRGGEIAPMFQGLLRARPRDVQLRFDLLDFFMKRGQVPAAREVMQDVLRLEPGHPQALQVLQQLQGR